MMSGGGSGSSHTIEEEDEHDENGSIDAGSEDESEVGLGSASGGVTNGLDVAASSGLQMASNATLQQRYGRVHVADGDEMQQLPSYTSQQYPGFYQQQSQNQYNPHSNEDLIGRSII